MTCPPKQSPKSLWIIGPQADLLSFLGPVVLATLLLPLLLASPRDDIPFIAYLFLVVAFDVAHVWASIYRTYLDRTELKRRPILYTLPPILIFLASYRLHLYSPAAFWTALAYIAIHHFISQNYGFLALYKAKAQDRDPIDFQLDKWTLWCGALSPVLLWHADPSRQFDWFDAGEQFLFRIDPSFRIDIITTTLVLLACYSARQLQLAHQGRFNLGKNLIMLLTWLTWAVGTQLDHPLVSLAFLNLFHGIPYIIIIWLCNQRRWLTATPSSRDQRFLAYLAKPQAWWLFFGLLLALAISEEALWDGLVWHRYLDHYTQFQPREFSPKTLSLIVAALALPQTVHYFLDGWIWKFDGSNPGLAQWLLDSPLKEPLTARNLDSSAHPG